MLLKIVGASVNRHAPFWQLVLALGRIEVLDRNLGAARLSFRAGKRRLAVAAVGVLFAGVTFAYFLPQIADYRDVWGVVKALVEWLVVLGAATILNLLTFAPPWMVALPGLKFRSALAMTQVSTALSIVCGRGSRRNRRGVWRPPPLGLRGPRDRACRHSRQPLEPVREPLLSGNCRRAALGHRWRRLARAGDGGDHRGAALVIAIAALTAVLASDRTALGTGDLTARVVNAFRRRLRREAVLWGHELRALPPRRSRPAPRRWHVLTLATYAGTLTAFCSCCCRFGPAV